MEKAMLLLGIIVNQHAIKLENVLNRAANAILDRINALIDVNVEVKKSLQSISASQESLSNGTTAIRIIPPLQNLLSPFEDGKPKSPPESPNQNSDLHSEL